jgi:hypothetical protein
MARSTEIVAGVSPPRGYFSTGRKIGPTGARPFVRPSKPAWGEPSLKADRVESVGSGLLCAPCRRPSPASAAVRELPLRLFRGWVCQVGGTQSVVCCPRISGKVSRCGHVASEPSHPCAALQTTRVGEARQATHVFARAKASDRPAEPEGGNDLRPCLLKERTSVRRQHSEGATSYRLLISDRQGPNWATPSVRSHHATRNTLLVHHSRLRRKASGIYISAGSTSHPQSPL